MANWFDRLLRRDAGTPPEAKQTGGHMLVSLSQLREASWSGRGFSSLVGSGFARNPVVYRCVRLIAEAANRVPWCAVADGRRTTEHPLLALLARPNPHQSGGELFEAVFAYLQTAGNAYLVPDETEIEILRRLSAISPIRAIAGVRQVSGAVYKRPISVTGPATGWVGETAARPQTASQQLDELSYPTMELYAMPAATSAFLEDAAVDVGQWIAEEIDTAFAAQETTAFVSGNGVNKPTGFLTGAKVAEADWEWGKLGYVASGVDGGLPAVNGPDVLIDLVHSLKAGYRQNASWVMNRGTQGTIRKLKDADGNYIWHPANAPDGRASLLGFPLVEAEDMPDIAADSFSIAFGDFRRGYLIVDRRGVSILRDPFSAKPYVLFYTTKRVGGGIADYAAIKLLKFSEE